MTWLWRIFFSLAPVVALTAATVSGRVELRDSKDSEVRSKLDYSGVVISLTPISVPTPAPVPRHAKILQQNKTFIPHILAIPVGSTVDFPNLDPIFHNAFSNYSGQLFDVGLYPPKTSRSVKFTREGVVRIFCNIHSSMSAVLVVLATPYFAMTGKDGAYSIGDVPPGDYKLAVFHERASPETLNKLTRRITVENQPVSLPPIEISESGYLPIPHKNKYGKDYGPEPDDHTVYPGARK
jgi:plastocyanin